MLNPTTVQSLITIQPNDIIVFDYTNWEGQSGTRTAKVYYTQFGATEYHKVPQWLLVAHDMDKQALRTFAMQDMRNVRKLNP